jgi:hypothetical protein
MTCSFGTDCEHGLSCRPNFDQSFLLCANLGKQGLHDFHGWELRLTALGGIFVLTIKQNDSGRGAAEVTPGRSPQVLLRHLSQIEIGQQSWRVAFPLAKWPCQHPPTGERIRVPDVACKRCAPLPRRSKRQQMVGRDNVTLNPHGAGLALRAAHQDLAKSSSRTRRKQRRALRVDRFGSERTQRNEVLSHKTGRQAKFCRTSDQNFLDSPRACNKIYCITRVFATNSCFPPSRPRSARPATPKPARGIPGKSNAMGHDCAEAS